MKIMALDPGGTTGIAVLDVSDEKYVAGSGIPMKLGMVGPHRHHSQLWAVLHRERPDVLVCEAFVYQIREMPDKHGKKVKSPTIDITAREYIGIAQLYANIHGIPFVQQTVGAAKPLWPNAKLKKLGVLKTINGKQHANDAARHLLLYLTGSTCKRWDYIIDLKPPG